MTTGTAMVDGLAGLVARFLAVTLLASSASALAQPIWRAGWGNDLLLDSDNQFTNGVFLQKISVLADSLAATSGTPAFGNSLARFVLPFPLAPTCTTARSGPLATTCRRLTTSIAPT